MADKDNRGEQVVILLKAAVGDQGFPADEVDDTPANRALYAELVQDIANRPPGTTVDIPFDWVTMPD